MRPWHYWLGWGTFGLVAGLFGWRVLVLLEEIIRLLERLTKP